MLEVWCQENYRSEGTKNLLTKVATGHLETVFFFFFKDTTERYEKLHSYQVLWRYILIGLNADILFKGVKVFTEC